MFYRKSYCDRPFHSILGFAGSRADRDGFGRYSSPN
jgi:hypothetical protein